MPAPDLVVQLVERFRENRKAYQSPQFNETQLRREFLDPLFTALGWDVDNKSGNAEAYKDVIHEDAIKIGGATKAPDYCFRIGGRRIFFLEAKKPSVNVKEDVSAAYQLRRYAWSAKLPLSILSDFEELALYDCRKRPDKGDKPSEGRIKFVTFEDYVDKWDELAAIFSKEAVLKGSFDRYAESTKTKRGTAEVDAAFLHEIESWRELLARNFAKRNDELNQRDLNFAVQRTIDRIIFLRMCEDRGIEQYGQLQALTNGEGVYGRLCQLFDRADERYNSGLFHFQAEKGRAEPPDELTQSLKLDDKPLKEILSGMYYPESPYEFSVLPAEILGQVYEQFLGKVIRLTAGHQAKIEEKPEVKKAGGVYYTPSYIVDYIVRNTVGKLVEGKTPREVSKVRVLDPACGSGSFLVGAYQFLLDWHRDWYVEDGAAKHKKQVYQGRGGQWFLTTAEKKAILLNNIYGVDIDSQAVEVTKLSLLLKVLENENRENLDNQLRLLHERALPDLSDNIKCGNSLIGSEFYKDKQMSLLDEEEQYRINVFDWRSEFPDVFNRKSGGFDAVIGNPPYIRIQAMKEWYPLEIEHYKKTYGAAAKGNYDIYVVFVQRSFELLGTSGRLGFIVPSKFLTTDYGQPLREYVGKRAALSALVDFGHELVFPRVSTYTVLLFLSRVPQDVAVYTPIHPMELKLQDRGPLPSATIDHSMLDGDAWLFHSSWMVELFDQLNARGTPLGQLAQISRGSSTGADQVFMLTVDGKELADNVGNHHSIESGILRVPLFATDFNRYLFAPKRTERIIFPYLVTSDGYSLIDESVLRNTYPLAFAYLRSRRRELESRKQFSRWFGFSAPRNLNVHDSADLMVPLLADKGMFAPYDRGATTYCPMASGGFSISLSRTCELPREFVLGLVNSKLLFWYLKQISNRFRGGWITCTKQYVEQLPIVMDPSRAIVDEVVELVRLIVNSNAELSGPKSPSTHLRLSRLVRSAEERVDQLVCTLYDVRPDQVDSISKNG